LEERLEEVPMGSARTEDHAPHFPLTDVFEVGLLLMLFEMLFIIAIALLYLAFLQACFIVDIPLS